LHAPQFSLDRCPPKPQNRLHYGVPGFAPGLGGKENHSAFPDVPTVLGLVPSFSSYSLLHRGCPWSPFFRQYLSRRQHHSHDGALRCDEFLAIKCPGVFGVLLCVLSLSQKSNIYLTLSQALSMPFPLKCHIDQPQVSCPGCGFGLMNSEVDTHSVECGRQLNALVLLSFLISALGNKRLGPHQLTAYLVHSALARRFRHREMHSLVTCLPKMARSLGSTRPQSRSCGNVVSVATDQKR
jgi:hypothetical protein